MRDPIRPPSFLVRATQPLSNALALRTLPLHVHEILPTFCIYHFINTSLSPRLSTYLFPTTYPHLPARTKVSWNSHVVSLLQSCFINSAALWVISADKERAGWSASQRVWGYTGATGMIQAFSTGYFLWDLMTGVLDFDVHGPGVVAHAISALAVSGLGYVRLYLLPTQPTPSLYILMQSAQCPIVTWLVLIGPLYKKLTPQSSSDHS